MVQTEARGETGAMMEGMVEEKGILPERSEWFRSRGIIGTCSGVWVIYCTSRQAYNISVIMAPP